MEKVLKQQLEVVEDQGLIRVDVVPIVVCSGTHCIITILNLCNLIHVIFKLGDSKLLFIMLPTGFLIRQEALSGIY